MGPPPPPPQLWFPLVGRRNRSISRDRSLGGLLSLAGRPLPLENAIHRGSLDPLLEPRPSVSGGARLVLPRVVEAEAVGLTVDPLERVVDVRQGVGPGVEGLEKLPVREGVTALHTLDVGPDLGTGGRGGGQELSCGEKARGRHLSGSTYIWVGETKGGGAYSLFSRFGRRKRWWGR